MMALRSDDFLPMRRWFLILLLLIYPFQVSLAMADQCCVATPGGITHHAAAQENGAPVAVPVFVADDAASSLADPHCPACVFGQVSAVPTHSAAVPATRHRVSAVSSRIPFLTSVPARRLERPPMA
ncbi:MULTISPECIES: hypothetical protein [unclassified Massilia]|uniref:hypothetical protein n=1 Tax=unclassified Massilia TaxID=2609279 RepID=UPI00178127B6|nr:MULTISPECIES: hypothetical protein [unclassified Massilia]MBD8533356.1 hypothetical protein [Massilia sp. CFBP 13647]MBD8676749.1 hypothetical protein [Massilia sp. CFBP 13721]